MSDLHNSGFSGSNSNLPDGSGRAFPTSFTAQSGNMHGLHGMHGHFNISNMPGAFGSRNSTMIGGPPVGMQQVAAIPSNGRFAINNLPAAMSQLSLGSSHGHSGVANSGGSATLLNMGNAGRITNSMANFVSGGSISRGLNSAGGSNLPGAASRLNLAGPQAVSVLGNSYSATGVPLSQNQYQTGNGPFTSLLLNDLSAQEETTFDNEFPQLGGHPASASGSQGQIGFLRKQNVGFAQQNQEFSIQNEDFPALPGYKGGNTEFTMNFHQKEQLHDSISPMMQSQHLSQLGRSAGVGFGRTSSSNYQQQLQHASSINGMGLPFVPSNYKDVHDLESRSMGQLPSGLGTINSPNALPGMGMYDQLPSQYQQFQMQSSFRSTNRFRDQDLRPVQTTQTSSDRFGMFGLLNIIRMTNPALTSLAMGEDLTTLGLDLNSSENVHKKFSSPWSSEPAKVEPEYKIPECYNARQSPELKPSYFKLFPPEALFYVFYSMPRDEAQLYAANELHNRGWFYHKEHRLWLMRVNNMEPLVKTNAYERGHYYCFDPNIWKTVRKDNFVLHYDQIEKRPLVPLA